MAQAAKKNISVLFTHYSVGGQMVRARCTMLDTLRWINANQPVTYGSDTAVISFRDYNLNYDLTTALSDTVIVNCNPNRFSGFTYRLGQDWGRLTLSGQDGVSSMLQECFNIPQAERDTMFFWRMFEEHNVPAAVGSSDSVVEKYDLILIKQAYYHWGEMDDAKRENYKENWQKIVDSITISNQGHNIGLLFGTPLYALDNDPPTSQTDSSYAHKTYELAVWFRDSLMTHNNYDSTRNLWLFDSYTHLCDTAVDNSTCWGLATDYWLSGDAGSHLSEPLAGNLAQDSLVSFIRRATRDILIQQSGETLVTPQDIDRMILRFRNGEVTQAEVQNLIELYNQQGGN